MDGTLYKVLVRRAQSRINQATLEKEVKDWEEALKASTSGLGKRCHHPTPAYSDSLRPSLAKSCEKIDFGWSRPE